MLCSEVSKGMERSQEYYTNWALLTWKKFGEWRTYLKIRKSKIKWSKHSTPEATKKSTESRIKEKIKIKSEIKMKTEK